MVWIIALIIMILPFTGYFIYSPIYRGDVEVMSSKPMLQNEITEAFGDGLLVIGLPGCKYCEESVATLKRIQARNIDLPIQMSIIGASKRELSVYKEMSAGKFKIAPLNSKNFTKSLQILRFPSYLWVEHGVVIEMWSNTYFGVITQDEIGRKWNEIKSK